MTKIQLLKKESYIAIINNSIGSALFKDVYGRINNQKVNLTNGGDLSCSFFVSSILKLFNIIDDIHLTVDNTVKDLIKNGSKKIGLKKIAVGDIIVWHELKGHQHIGFYIGHHQAVSNSSKLKKISRHHYTYNNKREIKEIFHIKIK